jgi:hypothetical protein
MARRSGAAESDGVLSRIIGACQRARVTSARLRADRETGPSTRATSAALFGFAPVSRIFRERLSFFSAIGSKSCGV